MDGWILGQYFPYVLVQGHEIKQITFLTALLLTQHSWPAERHNKRRKSTRQVLCLNLQLWYNSILAFLMFALSVCIHVHCTCVRMSVFNWCLCNTALLLSYELIHCQLDTLSKWKFCVLRKIPSGHEGMKRFTEPLFNRRLHGNTTISG